MIPLLLKYVLANTAETCSGFSFPPFSYFRQELKTNQNMAREGYSNKSFFFKFDCKFWQHGHLSMSWILAMNSRQGKELPSALTLRTPWKQLMVPEMPDNPSPVISHLTSLFLSKNITFWESDVSDPPILQAKLSPLSLVLKTPHLSLFLPHHTNSGTLTMDFVLSLWSLPMISEVPGDSYAAQCLYDTWHMHKALKNTPHHSEFNKQLQHGLKGDNFWMQNMRYLFAFMCLEKGKKWADIKYF